MTTCQQSLCGEWKPACRELCSCFLWDEIIQRPINNYYADILIILKKFLLLYRGIDPFYFIYYLGLCVFLMCRCQYGHRSATAWVWRGNKFLELVPSFHHWFQEQNSSHKVCMAELFSCLLYLFSGPSARNIENIFKMLAVMSIAARERLS